MPDLSKKQICILQFLAEKTDWVTRSEMEERAGKKGFSNVLGAPTKGPPKRGTLEELGFVERRDLVPPFEYRITDRGRGALLDYESEHGASSHLLRQSGTESEEHYAFAESDQKDKNDRENHFVETEPEEALEFLFSEDSDAVEYGLGEEPPNEQHSEE